MAINMTKAAVRLQNGAEMKSEEPTPWQSDKTVGMPQTQAPQLELVTKHSRPMWR